MIQQGLAIWSLVPLPLQNPVCTSESSWFMYCCSLASRILGITLLAWEMKAIVWYIEHSLALPFFGTGMKTDFFQSCDHCWVFQICWQTECSTLTESSFKTLNSSAGIPSPPLALLTVKLPKAHLTSHPRMSGSRSVTTPCDITYMWNLKCEKMNLLTKQKQTHRCREQTCGCRRGETVREGRIGSLGWTNASYYTQDR